MILGMLVLAAVCGSSRCPSEYSLLPQGLMRSGAITHGPNLQGHLGLVFVVCGIVLIWRQHVNWRQVPGQDHTRQHCP